MMTLGRISLLITIVSLGACGSSPPTRYYALDPVYSGPATQSLQDLKIGVGPFMLPNLLDRPQIVVRGSGNEVILSEFERWADDLDRRFQAVVANNMIVATGSDNIYEHPWRENFTVDFRILGVVDRFSADRNGSVELSLRWVIQEGVSLENLSTKHGKYNESADPDNYSDIAAAMSRVTAAATSDMVRELASVVASHSSSD